MTLTPKSATEKMFMEHRNKAMLCEEHDKKKGA